MRRFQNQKWPPPQDCESRLKLNSGFVPAWLVGNVPRSVAPST